MKLKIMAAALLGAAVLTACSHTPTVKTKPISSGTVVGKEYAPPWDEPISYKQQDGSYSSPVLEHHDECWTLAFTAHGDWNFACVSKGQYDSIFLGDNYGD